MTALVLIVLAVLGLLWLLVPALWPRRDEWNRDADRQRQKIEALERMRRGDG